MTDISPIEALGEPTRRKLLEHLRTGPLSVSELVKTVSVSQPAVSQHLRVLREARLVKAQKHGQQRVYSLDPQGIAQLRAYVESLWDDVLGAFQAVADQAGRPETKPKEELSNE